MMNTISDPPRGDVQDSELLAQLRAMQIVLRDAQGRLTDAQDQLSVQDDLKRLASAAISGNRELEVRLALSNQALRETEDRRTSLQRQLDARSMELSIAMTRAAQAEAELWRMRASVYWRISQPLRRFLERHVWLRRALRRMLTAMRRIFR